MVIHHWTLDSTGQGLNMKWFRNCDFVLSKLVLKAYEYFYFFVIAAEISTPAREV